MAWGEGDATREEAAAREELIKAKKQEGFCVYRIKTQVVLDDYLDLVLEDWPHKDKKEPEPLKEFKDTLLDLFLFYVHNVNYDTKNANNYITKDDYQLLYEKGLPENIGKNKIEIYPQLFQEKFLDKDKDERQLTPNCRIHLDHLKKKKKIIEASKNLNIYLLIECLKEEEEYKYPDDFYNLMLFLHKLSYKINNKLKTLNALKEFNFVSSFKSLNDNVVNGIIKCAKEILEEDPITTKIREKLKYYLTYKNSDEIDLVPEISLRSSTSRIVSNPKVDKHIKEGIDENLFLYIQEDIDEQLLEDLLTEDTHATRTGGKKSKKKINVYKKTRKKHNKKINIENSYSNKKLKKSKKKIKVNKKTKNKHNKKNKRTRRKKNNKTEKKVRK